MHEIINDDDDIVLFFDLNHEVPRQFHVQIHTEQIDVYKQQTNKQMVIMDKQYMDIIYIKSNMLENNEMTEIE